MTSTVVHANDLDRARALLANDPDEMDEEWLAEIIAAVRAEATAAPCRSLTDPAENKYEAVTLCEDCPPVGYSTDDTRCLPCPRRPAADRLSSLLDLAHQALREGRPGEAELYLKGALAEAHALPKLPP